MSLDIWKRDIFPDEKKNIKDDNTFKCFKFFEPKSTKVIIMGEAPYNSYSYIEGIKVPNADGLAFSCTVGTKLAPLKLRKIFKQLEIEYGQNRINTDLSDWAKQGVLLLNSILDDGDKDWDIWTRQVVEKIVDINPHVIILLMDNKAKYNFEGMEIVQKVIVEEIGFFDISVFREINAFLAKKDENPINWIGDEVIKM